MVSPRSLHRLFTCKRYFFTGNRKSGVPLDLLGSSFIIDYSFLDSPPERTEVPKKVSAKLAPSPLVKAGLQAEPGEILGSQLT